MAKNITSLQHPIVKHLVHLHQNRDYREEHQSAVIEGKKLISEVCFKQPAKLLLALDESLIPANIKAKEVLIVPQEIIKKISGLQNPDGFIAEVTLPKPTSFKGMKWIIACDGINDPGNLGTLLRSGLALGWEGAFILNNTCDPFNDKAIRAAKGATFRLPMAHGSWSDLNKIIQSNKLKPLVADMEGKDVAEFSIKPGVLLVLSNESQGVSEEANEHCERISIPMSGKMESLNVAAAGGILMYELRRKP